MKLSKRKLNNTWQCYLMISTQILGLLVFTLYPMGWAVKKAFYYYTGVPSETTYTGIANFIDLFKDVTYWKTWVTTIQFTLIKLAIEYPIAMILALILNNNIKGRGLFRAVYYLPNIVSVAIVGLIFGNMFDYFGFVNAVFMKLGIIKEEIYWMGSFWHSLTVLIVGSVWTGFGINTLYFLAGLSNIPKELYESAYLEGAGKFTAFRKITVPLMGPILQTIILLGINGTLHVADYVIVTTNGAPGGQTLSVMAYQISKFVPGFMDSSAVTNLGYGCAMAIITSIFMCVIALTYNKLSDKMNDIY